MISGALIAARERSVRWLLAVVAGVVSAGLLGGVLSGSAGARSSLAPRVQKVSVLYALDARAGTLRPLAGKPGRFELTLARVAPDVVWFSDRPARHRGRFPDAGLASDWNGFGFGSRAPEAALVFDHGQPDGNAEILKLTAPRYDKRHDALSFAASWVDPRTVTTGNLAAYAKTVDPTPPRSFNAATLLINQTTAPVIKGCIIEPYTKCIDADLRGADLRSTHLDGANLGRANLTDGRLANANLTEADLVGAILYHWTYLGSTESR